MFLNAEHFYCRSLLSLCSCLHNYRFLFLYKYVSKNHLESWKIFIRKTTMNSFTLLSKKFLIYICSAIIKIYQRTFVIIFLVKYKNKVTYIFPPILKLFHINNSSIFSLIFFLSCMKILFVQIYTACPLIFACR